MRLSRVMFCLQKTLLGEKNCIQLNGSNFKNIAFRFCFVGWTRWKQNKKKNNNISGVSSVVTLHRGHYVHGYDLSTLLLHLTLTPESFFSTVVQPLWWPSCPSVRRRAATTKQQQNVALRWPSASTNNVNSLPACPLDFCNSSVFLASFTGFLFCLEHVKVEECWKRFSAVTFGRNVTKEDKAEYVSGSEVGFRTGRRDYLSGAGSLKCCCPFTFIL